MGRPARSRTVERAVIMEKGRAGYQSNLEEGCKKGRRNCNNACRKAKRETSLASSGNVVVGCDSSQGTSCEDGEGSE